MISFDPALSGVSARLPLSEGAGEKRMRPAAASARPMQLLIATANPGKVREFREMLGGERFAYTDLSQHGAVTPVEETGATFLENACLKAAGYATQFNTWALADDSGLEVDALGGAPGVHSARWAE